MHAQRWPFDADGTTAALINIYAGAGGRTEGAVARFDSVRSQMHHTRASSGGRIINLFAN